MLASWPGVGNVSLIATRFLRERLDAVPLGFIDPLPFFTPPGIIVEKNIVQEPQFPRNIFYGWKSPKGERDLLFFIGDSQPASRGYELAERVIQFAEKAGAEMIITLAAALSSSQEIENPRVWAVATEKSLLNELKDKGLLFRGELHIAGLNGLLLGIAKMRKIQGLCFLGEVPSHLTQVPYPKASLAVLEALKSYLELELDLTEMRKLVRDSEAEMKNISNQAMKEFLENYTMPIWEREEDKGD